MPDKNELGKHTLTEIWEIPQTLRNLFNHPGTRRQIKQIAQAIHESGCVSIYVFGSGTSYHAGLVSTYWFSQLAKIPTHCELAPEFPYLIEPIIAPKHVSICISQSGESELTVYAAQKAQERGSFVIGVTNEADSQLATLTGDHSIITQAGTEQSILATKTYVSQLGALLALALDLAILRETITQDLYVKYWRELEELPGKIDTYFPLIHSQIQQIAPVFKFSRNCFVIGAGPDYGNCMETALKLKEGARIFAQAFSTAETPHGPITLLSDPRDAFVLCIIPRPEAEQRYNDIIKLNHRLRERGVTILRIGSPTDIENSEDLAIDIPPSSEILQPILSILPIQILVVEISRVQNIDCDTPKFLSKVSKL